MCVCRGVSVSVLECVWSSLDVGGQKIESNNPMSNGVLCLSREGLESPFIFSEDICPCLISTCQTGKLIGEL